MSEKNETPETNDEKGKVMPMMEQPTPEQWRLTSQIRWMQIENKNAQNDSVEITYNLQQLIVSNHGNQQWQNVPMVKPDEK